MAKGTSATKRQRTQSTIPGNSSGRTRRVSCHASGRGYSYVPPGKLPTELWMQIIGEHSSRKELLALCKTSRFLHQIAQICLYKRLDLDGYRDRSRILEGDLKNSLSLFERSLRYRPQLGILVHDLSVYAFYPSGKKRVSPRALLSKLDKLPNLTKIRVQGTHVTADLCDAIHFHPRLRVVEFNNCSLDDSLLACRTQLNSQGTISELKIIGPCHRYSAQGGIWDALVPVGLLSLEVYHRAFMSDPGSILSDIASSAKSSMLEKLIINFLPSSIIHFLISAPRLRHLMIRDETYHHHHLMFSSFPGDAIPALEYYEGPAELSPILLQNRPVHTIVLTSISYSLRSDMGKMINILESLRLSSVPIAKLKVDFILDGAWLKHIPATISHLTFPLYNQNVTLKSACLELSRLADLHTICVTLTQAQGRLKFTGEDILQVSQSCPSLREFDFDGHEKWVMVKPKVWERLKYQIIQNPWL